MENSQVFATVLNDLEDFVLIMKVDQDGNFRYFYANETALKKGNIRESDYGKTLHEVLPYDRANLLKDKYHESINNKKRMIVEAEVKLQSGNVFGETTATPIYLETGTYVTVVARNITEQKLNEDKLYTANDMLDSFLDSSGDGTLILDKNNIVTKVNKAYLQIFGFSESGILGHTPEDWQTPEDALNSNRVIELVKQGKESTNYQTQRTRKGGTLVDISASFSPFRNSKGEIIGVIISVRNISEEKKVVEELRISKEKYRLIARNTSDLIKAFDMEGIIRFASPSHEKMLGYPAKTILEQSIYKYIHPDDHEKVRETLDKISTRKEPMLVQQRLSSTSGEWVTVESILTPIVNKGGSIESFLSVSRNITVRLKNEELIRNLDRLSIIGQLAAGVAHEIRNPLTALKGFSKILYSTLSLPDQKRYLNIMLDELNRIDLIVGEFMSLAKPQAVEFEEGNIKELIKGTITVIETQASLHNIIINCTFEDEKELLINCQQNQIKQIFINFIKNAIEAMDKGGIIDVSISQVDRNFVVISISDEGIGIEEERIQYLGTPFYTTKEKGIGLGLTISNKIIKEHGGKMVIKSKPNQGTTVEVYFPILIKNYV